MSSLTKQQQTTLIYIVGTAVSLALSILLIYNLGSSRASLKKLKQQVEQKERQVKNAKPASQTEQDQWKEAETALSNLLLPDQALSQLMEEITKIAADSGIQQRLGVNTEEASIDAGNPGSPDNTKLAAAGIRHYLVIRMKFQGQYADIARFLGGVSKLDRPIEIRLVNLKRAVPLIDVEVILNVY